MTRKDAQLITEIREYIDANLFAAHPIRQLCQKFMINREKLQTGFHNLVDSTVHAYIVRRRLELAALRLLETDDSIKVIALDSGYKKQRSFNKTFKQLYNLTPASYRRENREPTPT